MKVSKNWLKLLMVIVQGDAFRDYKQENVKIIGQNRFFEFLNF
jgi:hypothetical protein